MKEIGLLLRSPTFILLTVLGNGLIGVCGAIFYFLEFGKNPKLMVFLDALWWSFTIATTTGNDMMPVTPEGKVLSIFLMLIGMALFSMYTALFAEAILNSRPPKSSDASSRSRN